MSTAAHSSSDAPGARHVTTAPWGSDRRYRWVCSCGQQGKRSYEMKSVAAKAGWTHERAMNGLPS